MANHNAKLHNNATIIGDPSTSSTPMIICFHGSGDSCASWVPLANLLSDQNHHILLWDRGELNPKPEVAVRDMLAYLEQQQQHEPAAMPPLFRPPPPPYVLIAHSYGGTFAREFLRQRPQAIAGMVLVETGQETALDAKVEAQQYRKQVLGDKPLSVVRANTLIRKWAQHEEALREARGDAGKDAALAAQRLLLDATDREDERLKRAQLALSRNHRYLHVPDCGHNVIRDRPDVVATEVAWVMDNMQVSTGSSSLWHSISLPMRRMLCCISENYGSS